LLVSPQSLLDRLDKLNSKAIDLDVTLLDKKIDQMMPELGFKQADNDRLVASFSGGWQMRMCLGKLLLQVGSGVYLEGCAWRLKVHGCPFVGCTAWQVGEALADDVMVQQPSYQTAAAHVSAHIQVAPALG
jgi:hypothetical protein